MNIASIDLNLLVALDALLTERHVSRAAKRMGLSQPAMSNALARLRQIFEDPLLVRTPRGMMPTPRALELREPIRTARITIERAIAPPQAFDPAVSDHTFTITASDAAEFTLLPPLMDHLKRLAPYARLVVNQAQLRLPTEEMERGEIDLAIGAYGDIPASIASHELYKEDFRCLVRQGHPLLSDRLNLEQFVNMAHIRVSWTGPGPGRVDQELRKLGLERRVALWIPHFLAAPLVVAQSDCIVTLGERLARAFARVLPLKVLDPPVELPGYAISMAWHRRMENEPAHRWLRELLIMLARDL